MRTEHEAKGKIAMIESLTQLIAVANEKYEALPEGATKRNCAVCINDAAAFATLPHKSGHTAFAAERALKSLAWSVGVLHPTYEAARLYVAATHPNR